METAAPGTTSSPAARLHGIEALRGAAATAVVLSHAARHVDKAFGAPGLIHAFQPGHAGVDLFFVVSGFIILFVHRGDVGRPERLRRYLGRRFNRVFPLYWIALALTVAMSLAGGHPPPPLGRFLASALLLPVSDEPLLGIAWTLQFEAVFYAVFATLIVSRRAGAALLAAWLAGIAAAVLGHGAPGVPAPLCGLFGVEFFMGMGAALLVRRVRMRRPASVAAIGSALFVTALALDGLGVLDGFGAAARFAYGIPATLMVFGVAAAEQARPAAIPRWQRTLGGASYSIYLFQFVFIGPVWQVWQAAGWREGLYGLPLFLALSASALAGGVATSRLVEKPLLRLLRGPSKTAAPLAA